MKQLTPNEAEQLKQLLASIGWEAKPKRKPRSTNGLTARQILSKSKWYRLPSLSDLAKNHRSTAYGMTEAKWESIKSNYRFPYKDNANA